MEYRKREEMVREIKNMKEYAVMMRGRGHLAYLLGNTVFAVRRGTQGVALGAGEQPQVVQGGLQGAEEQRAALVEEAVLWGLA